MPVVGCSCTGPLLSTGPLSSRAAKSLPIQSCLMRHEPIKSHRRQRWQHRHGVVTISSMRNSDGRAPCNRSSRHHSAGWQPLAELHGRTLCGTSLAIAVPALWSLGGGGDLGGIGGFGGGGGGSGGSGPGVAAWGPHQDINDQHHAYCSTRPPAASQSTQTVHPAGGNGGDFDHQQHPVYELAAGDEDDDDSETQSDVEEEAEEATGGAADDDDDDSDASEDDDEGDRDVESDDEEEAPPGKPSVKGEVTGIQVRGCDDQDTIDEIMTMYFPELHRGAIVKPGDLASGTRMAAENGTPITAKMGEDGVVRINIPGLSSKEKLRSLEVKTVSDGESLMPTSFVQQVIRELPLGPKGEFTARSHRILQERIRDWYQDHGFEAASVYAFEGLDTGHVVARVVEPRISDITIERIDDSDQPVLFGVYPDSVFTREISSYFKPGRPYMSDDVKRCFRDLLGAGLIESAGIAIEGSQGSPASDSYVLTLQVRERPAQSTDVMVEWPAEWKQGPGKLRFPWLGAAIPGMEINYENRRLRGKDQQLSCHVASPPLNQATWDSLDFTIDWKAPFVRGSSDPNRRARVATFFRSNKQSPNFMARPNDGSAQPSPLMVDRRGVRFGWQETYTRNSSGFLGVVAHEVSVIDQQQEAKVSHAMRVTPGYGQVELGPPVNLSGGNVDRTAFLQASLIRDTTFQHNQSPLGARDIFTVEQGLGIGAAKLFNRMTVDSTRFIHLLPKRFRISRRSRQIVPTLVLHGRAGTCVGDLANYDLFPIGGPNSVRGFNVGELGSGRSFLEGAAELRLPLPKLSQHIYGFVEHGRDLGSSKQTDGNPTLWLGKPGRGTAVGTGIRLGPCRLEVTRDLIGGKPTWWAQFGERF